jgi:hypothetical protein
MSGQKASAQRRKQQINRSEIFGADQTYLISARNHGRRPIDAIRDALTANPWMPPQTA